MRILLNCEYPWSAAVKLRYFLRDSLCGELLTYTPGEQSLEIVEVDELEDDIDFDLKGEELFAAVKVKDGVILDFGDFQLKIDPGEFWSSTHSYLDVVEVYKYDVSDQFEHLLMNEVIPNTSYVDEIYKIVTQKGEELHVSEAGEVVDFFENHEEGAKLEDVNICFHDGNEWKLYGEDEIAVLYWRNGWICVVFYYQRPLLLKPQNARL